MTEVIDAIPDTFGSYEARISRLVGYTRKRPDETTDNKALEAMRVVVEAAPVGVRVVEGNGTGDSDVDIMFALDSEHLVMSAVKQRCKPESLDQVTDLAKDVVKWLEGDETPEAQKAAKDLTQAAALRVIYS